MCHMKKGRAKIKTGIALLFCAGIMLVTGCGGKQAEGEQTQPEQTEKQAGEEQAQTEQQPEEKRPPSEQAGQLSEAQIRHYYGGILSQIIAAWQFPDGEMDTSALEIGYGEMRDNHFAVTDIDGDGREELIVSYLNASMAGMKEMIYDYDPVLGELKRELTEFPALTYYDNGIIKAEASHNHTCGIDFWPFGLYRYAPESDTYVRIGYVSA